MSEDWIAVEKRVAKLEKQLMSLVDALECLYLVAETAEVANLMIVLQKLTKEMK